MKKDHGGGLKASLCVPEGRLASQGFEMSRKQVCRLVSVMILLTTLGGGQVVGSKVEAAKTRIQ